MKENHRICAGIILYNPDLNRLVENIDSIISQVNEVVIIDNASNNSDEIQICLKNKGEKLVYLRNHENFGIAKALNQILDFAVQRYYDAFITLDQDSICGNELVENYLNIDFDGIGQISCVITDRNTGTVDCTSFDDSNVKKVESVITSGCLNVTNAIKTVGGFDESLFIDGVDIDLSLRLKQREYEILKINYHGLLHELGQGKKKRILGRDFILSNHNPIRNYYTRRNMIYIARKYYSGIKKHKMIIKQIIYGIGASVLEDQKIKRIKCNLKGIKDGLCRNIN